MKPSRCTADCPRVDRKFGRNELVLSTGGVVKRASQSDVLTGSITADQTKTAVEKEPA
jgi:hypothetical protein